jgi:phosphoribosylformylglycinamidine (FGAM) synthase PurS component
VGKDIEMVVDAADARPRARRCGDGRRFLSNPVIEDYRIVDMAAAAAERP